MVSFSLSDRHRDMLFTYQEKDLFELQKFVSYLLILKILRIDLIACTLIDHVTITKFIRQ